MNENKEKTAGNLANSVVEGYDYSVAVRMSGRAGAYSPTGGKGNAFEVMYSDKKNLSNLLKPDTTTTLTNSSTARQVDLVTKKGNRIIERIQCKDTPSAKGTMDTIKRVQNGQYRTTQLVGTSESAAAFNAKAPSQGVTKVMKDSGISTKDTTRVSNKFNGVQSSTGIANAAKSSAKLGGAFGGGMAAVESIVNGDDLSTTTGNVASGALKGSVSGAGGNSRIRGNDGGSCGRTDSVSRKSCYRDRRGNVCGKCGIGCYQRCVRRSRRYCVRYCRRHR